MTDKDGKDGGEKRARPRRGRGRSRSRDKVRSEPAAASEDDGTHFDPDGEGPLKAAGPEKKGRERDRSPRPRQRRRSASDVEEIGASTGIDVLDIPSDGKRTRRSGALQPGLTLNDLLPFLRPPKTVLVLGASTGDGHNRAAAALHEGFKAVDRNLIVRQHDALELVTGDVSESDVRELLEETSRSPALFGEPFETMAGSTGSEQVERLNELLPTVFGERMDQMVVDKRPDHIVCTHWLPFRHLEKLKEEERLSATVTAVIADPDVHAWWTSSVVGHYIVSEESLKTRLQRTGVDPSNITVTGTPVSSMFAGGVDRDYLLRSNGLNASQPTILLRSDGIGATERVIEVVEGLLGAAPVNLLAVVGDDQPLKEALDGLAVENGSILKPLSSVQNMHELMGSADLLISRAAPHTMAEACASGLPVLILRPSPGIEERMADQLVRAGSALKAYGARDLECLFTDLMKNRRHLQDLQEAAQRRRRPDAASAVVDRIARIVN